MNFKKYSSYSVEAFLEDLEFRNWVNHPTPQNNQFWKNFLLQYPEQEADLKKARNILLQMNEYFATNQQRLSMPEETFREVLLQTMEAAKERKKVTLRRRKLSRRLAIAASFALLLATLSWLVLVPAESLQTVATGYGEWKTVALPDGSTVELNANSSISFASDWPETIDRKVWLKGEAFFQVEKKPATGVKFQVVTEGLTVEVLGTSFNVHSRGEKTKVFLEEGKIRLDLGDQEEYLDPGDFIVYSAEQKQITQRQKAPAETHTSWKDGSLILKDATVAEILEKIEEIYGLTIILENKAILSDKKALAVPMDKIEIAIPILENTLNVSLEKVDNQLIIK